jgi:pimeloyl-ACP methyl ester carboxylesterase
MISRRSSLFAFFYIITLAVIALCQKNDLEKVYVDLVELPNPFTNKELPSEPTLLKENLDNGVFCYSMFGCYKVIPMLNFRPDPRKQRTKFTIVYNSTESVIKVETLDNCLMSNQDDCERYPFNLQQIKDSPFRPDRRTIIIIGGFRSKGNGSWEASMLEIWQKFDDVNLIVVDWSDSNNGVYQMAATNTRPVARQMTVLLYYLAKLKGDPGLELNDDAYLDKFYLVGHSLGAHLAGFVGSDLAGKLGRITGLDPAGPTFDSLDRQFRIDPSDARLVDILHTNAGAKIFSVKSEFGSALASGHIDLWANDGHHQPGCKSEILGCSHKLAIEYYVSFLTDALVLRKRYQSQYQPLYRLRAYRSHTFESFRVGESLSIWCPIATLDDHDLRYSDLAQCSIPIDYVSYHSEFKHELETVHGLDFNDAANHPNNFYFYTSADPNNQMDHYMIKIRVSKTTKDDKQLADSRHGDDSSAMKGCSIGVNIGMASGSDSNYKIDNYHLFEFDDHSEILLPYLAVDSDVKYEMAGLDEKDFYVVPGETNGDVEFIPDENSKPLREAFENIFPASVLLSGFKSDGVVRKKRGVFQSIKNFFKGKSSSSADDETIDGEQEVDKVSKNISHGVNCQLKIESFIVQPLRKFRRHVSAFYSRDCSSSGLPPTAEMDIILVSDHEPSSSSIRSKLFDKAASDGLCSGLDDSPRMALRTVIIGPSLKVDREESDYEGLPDGSELDVAVHEAAIDQQDDDTQTDDDRRAQARLWFLLSVLLLFIVLIMIFVSALTVRYLKIDKVKREHTLTILRSNPNPIYRTHDLDNS